MPSLTLKDLPVALHRRLKEEAARHRRSLNQQAIRSLEVALSPQPVDAVALLERARALRRRVHVRTTNREVDRLKRSGRP